MLLGRKNTHDEKMKATSCVLTSQKDSERDVDTDMESNNSSFLANASS